MNPIIGTADWHLLDGGEADDSCEDGIRFVVEQSLRLYQPEAFVVLGDMVEGWQGTWRQAMEAHGKLLRWMDRSLASCNVPLVVVPGNHDAVTVEEMIGWLRTKMPICDISGAPLAVSLGGWYCTHGHTFGDPWNTPGPLQLFARGATGLAGLVERAIPGFKATWIDPTRLVSPARAQRAGLQTAIQEAADREVKKVGRILHGHTHRRRISSDRNVVCVGCCVDGRGEFAAVWPDGTAVLHEME